MVGRGKVVGMAGLAYRVNLTIGERSIRANHGIWHPTIIATAALGAAKTIHELCQSAPEQLTEWVAPSRTEDPAYASITIAAGRPQMTIIRELQDLSETLHREAVLAPHNGQRSEARSKAWRAALAIIQAAALHEPWQLDPENASAETVVQLSLQMKDRRTFALFASAEALDPDAFIGDLDPEDLRERVAFTGEFIQRMKDHLGG